MDNNTIICPKCGKESLMDTNFCPECGTKLNIENSNNNTSQPEDNRSIDDSAQNQNASAENNDLQQNNKDAGHQQDTNGNQNTSYDTYQNQNINTQNNGSQQSNGDGVHQQQNINGNQNSAYGTYQNENANTENNGSQQSNNNGGYQQQNTAGNQNSAYGTYHNQNSKPLDPEVAEYVKENQAYYMQRFNEMKMLNKKTSWNWCAFLVTPIWMVYRKMYAFGAGYMGLVFLLTIQIPFFSTLIFVSIVMAIAAGVLGNYIYLSQIEKKIMQEKMLHPDQRPLFRRENSGTNTTAVIIAIAVIVVLILILGAIATAMGNLIFRVFTNYRYL